MVDFNSKIKLLPEIPWYRTRKFWGFAIGIIIIYVILIYYIQTSTASSISVLTIKQHISYAINASGAAAFSVYGFKLFGSIGGYLSLMAYFILLGFCTYKIFEKSYVRLRYPIIFLLIFIPSCIISFLFIGSFI